MYKDIDMKGLETTLLPLHSLVIIVIIFKMLAGDIVCCMHIHVSIIVYVVLEEIQLSEGHGIVLGASSC